jgi:hypothetical protein
MYHWVGAVCVSALDGSSSSVCAEDERTVQILHDSPYNFAGKARQQGRTAEPRPLKDCCALQVLLQPDGTSAALSVTEPMRLTLDWR